MPAGRGELTAEAAFHGGYVRVSDDLLESVALHGVLEPVQVRDGYLLIEGRHRYVAARLAGWITDMPVVRWSSQ